MLSHRVQSREGFTMVELVIAIILIAIVSITSMEFFVQYLKLSLQTPSKVMAINYAQQKIESLYMDGTWNSNTDYPCGGIGRTWSTADSATSSDYAVLTVNVQTL